MTDQPVKPCPICAGMNDLVLLQASDLAALREELHAKHIEWDGLLRDVEELRKHRDDWQAAALKSAEARLAAESELAETRFNLAEARAMLRDFSANYDCDTGPGGFHADHCRACSAKALLGATQDQTL